MSNHEGDARGGVVDTGPPARDLAPPRVGRRRAEAKPRRRVGPQRDSPVFVPLAGFFTGLALVIVVPGAFGAVLSALFDRDTATRLLPYGLAVFAVPLVLVVTPRSRRFGLYLLLGMVVTALVVVGVAAATLVFLLSRDG